MDKPEKPSPFADLTRRKPDEIARDVEKALGSDETDQGSDSHRGQRQAPDPGNAASVRRPLV